MTSGDLVPKKLILLPGLDGTGQLFAPLLEHLDHNFQVKIITYPSDKQLSVFDLAHLVREQVSFDKNTLLLAESFSGLVLLALLQQDELPVHSIILCACFANPPHPKLLKGLVQLPLDKLLGISIPILFLRYFGLGWQTHKKESHRIQKAISQVDPKVLEHRLSLIANSQAPQLKQLSTIPCHYLQASNDKLVPKDSATLFQHYFTNLALHQIPQAGHFVLQSQPLACAKIIQQISLLPAL